LAAGCGTTIDLVIDTAHQFTLRRGRIGMAYATPALGDLATDGFTVTTCVFTEDECCTLATQIQAALAACPDEKTALRRANGVTYGARNFLAVFPPAITLWRRQPLLDLLRRTLGPGFGLVRALFFDKPPRSNWSLPWHQDLTIAVKDHTRESSHFRNRTRKANVPHVEAPDDVLGDMLTLRIHLDEVTDENGPLQVLPGTHGSSNAAPRCSAVKILVKAGDVLAMRPLLTHCSGASAPATDRHRRVIHLEFASNRTLPDGYAWYEYWTA
jgi:hypothetical protein